MNTVSLCCSTLKKSVTAALLCSALGLVACRAGSQWPWFLGGNITSLQSQIHCPSYSKVREITQTLSIMSLAAIFR